MRDFLASLGSLLILTGGLVLCFFFALYDWLLEAVTNPAEAGPVNSEALAPEPLAGAA